MSKKWSSFFALMEEANKYPNRSTFAKEKRNAYNAAKDMGVLDNLFPVAQWSKHEAILAAMQYHGIATLKRDDRALYRFLKQERLIEEIELVFSFMRSPPWQEMGKKKLEQILKNSC